MQTTIHVVSGFLGAGKTTLIQKILPSMMENGKICIVENEFGEVGIDGTLLRRQGLLLREVNQGCICCSMVGDFRRGLEDLIRNEKPSTIIIEPSGVAKLTEICRSIERIEERVSIQEGWNVAVVDAKRFFLYWKNFGDFYQDQIKRASAVILTHQEGMTPEEQENIERIIEKPVWKKTLDNTGTEELLEFLEKGTVDKFHIDEVGGDDFVHFTLTPKGHLSRESIKAVLLNVMEKFPIYRIKGFLSDESGTYLLQAVLGEVQISSYNQEERETLVFIGKDCPVKDIKRCLDEYFD